MSKASEELEDRESLAQLTASGEDVYSADGKTYKEMYQKELLQNQQSVRYEEDLERPELVAVVALARGEQQQQLRKDGPI